MRKGQKKIIDEALGKGFSEEYISFLEQSELPLKDLELVFSFFSGKVKNNTIGKNIDEDMEALQHFLSNPDMNTYVLFELGKLKNIELQKLYGYEVRFLDLILSIKECNAIPFDDILNYAVMITKVKEQESVEKIGIGYGTVLRIALTLSYRYYRNDYIKADYKDYPIYEKIAFAKAAYQKFLQGELTSRNEPIDKVECFLMSAFSNFSSLEEYETTTNQLLEWKEYLKKNNLEEDKVLIHSPYEEYIALGKKMIQMNSSVYDIVYSFPDAPVINTKISFSAKAFSICFLKSTKMEAFFDARTKEAAARITNHQGLRKYLYYCDTNELYYEYSKKNIKRIIPVNLNVLRQDLKEFGKPIELFLDKIIEIRINMGDYIFKDLKNILQYPMCPPFLLSEFNGCSSLKEMCNKKYKKDIPIVWNKGNLFINYLVYKCFLKIEEKDRNILLNWNNSIRTQEAISSFFATATNCYSQGLSTDNYCTFLLGNIILERIFQETSEERKEYYPTVADYVNMSYQLKRKLKLRFRSIKKLKEAHDRLAIDQRNKTIPKINIPKESVFYKLRKQLPKEFEWIKTRKRLVEEGYYMHHCVASYYDYINKDKSAIYSFVYERTNTRYTIEFICIKGKYIINQIESRGNGGCPEEVVNYVNKYLK